MKVKNKLNSKEIIKKIEKNSKNIRKYDVRKIGLFGSFLKNKQKRNSDVDIIVNFDEVSFKKYV